MTKKFIVKDVWLLDEHGNKTLKLNSLNADDVFKEVFDIMSVRGGTGKGIEFDKYNKGRDYYNG